MVLSNADGRAGLCTGVVIAPKVVLSAAHCVKNPAQSMIHYRAGDKPILLPVAQISIHPEFKVNAPKTRERSIDLALIQLREPLPEYFEAAILNTENTATLGTRYLIAGFGLTIEGRGDTSGKLRMGEVSARSPLSKLLLWLEDMNKRGFGACTGDSGGPVFIGPARQLFAITTWTEGAGKNHCGTLTQATLVAPQRSWIEQTLRIWGLSLP
jgi:V8-like Glu-specific endopeptidase